MLITIITFILVFGLIVLVHEFGHYFFAVRAGILVREFSIGMGPKVWWRRGKNGTTFTIRILPLGGYVRFAGDDDDDEEHLRPGSTISISLNDDQEVDTIDVSKGRRLLQGIPLQVVDHDLTDKLFIAGYVNGDESAVKRYPVNHDAVIVEPDGTSVRIAPRDVLFQSASLGNRMLTNFAGPFNNFILSLVVFVILGFTLPGIPTGSNRLGNVQSAGPAARAGLVTGDRVVKVNHHRVASWQELSQQISTKPGQTVTVTYDHNGQQRSTRIKTKTTMVNKQKVGRIGIEEEMSKSPAARIRYGWNAFVQSGTLIFSVLGHMVTHGFNVNDFGGPVAMYAGTSQATHYGINGVLSFLAALSINLGIVNLLPIPALDGGKLLLNIIEAIIRRPIPEKVEVVVTLIGFSLLLLLMILVTYNDIQRYFVH